METGAWDWAGASVTGSSHRREGRSNEDAWLGFAHRRGAGVVVADGMGSRSQARLGSRQACRAVRIATRRWGQAPGVPTHLLLRLVHLEWQIRVHPQAPADCATTCVFALARGDRLLLAQLGDGLAAALRPSGELLELPSPERDFTNETSGLGVARSLAEWRTLEVSAPPGTLVLLATDGVSEELREGVHTTLARWLHGELVDRTPRDRWRWLCAQLRALGEPGRVDDKTIVLLWHNGVR